MEKTPGVSKMFLGASLVFLGALPVTIVGPTIDPDLTIIVFVAIIGGLTLFGFGFREHRRHKSVGK